MLLAEMNMGMLSFGHWIVVALVVFLLFGPGRISDIMGDLGVGIRTFRDELTGAGEREEPVAPQGNPVLDAASAEPGVSQIGSE